MKFVKAKELVIMTLLIESVKVEKKPNVIAQKVMTKPPIHLWPDPSQKRNLYQSQNEVLKHNTFATIVEFKDILGQISTSFKHWKMQVLKGQKDKEMARGTTSNQKDEKSILVLVMWWRW